MERAQYDEEVVHATQGEGSSSEDASWQQLLNKITSHYANSHTKVPESIEPGASLVNGTTISGNTAFHQGNESLIDAGVSDHSELSGIGANDHHTRPTSTGESSGSVSLQTYETVQLETSPELSNESYSWSYSGNDQYSEEIRVQFDGADTNFDVEFTINGTAPTYTRSLGQQGNRDIVRRVATFVKTVDLTATQNQFGGQTVTPTIEFRESVTEPHTHPI